MRESKTPGNGDAGQTLAPVSMLDAVNRAVDAMKVTQRLFQLSDDHVLMQACSTLDIEAHCFTEEEYMLEEIWAHMRGYDLDGKRRNPYDSDSCARNWNEIHRKVAKWAEARGI